jgi:hypothetical protein
MSEAKIIVLKPRTALEIHENVVNISKNLKANYIELFRELLEVERRQIYHQFDLPSLYVYCVEMLDLSRNIACDFINVVRKAHEVQSLQNAICNRGLSISRARKICPVITDQNAEEWIELALTATCRILEKAVAMAKPDVLKSESLKYVSADHLSLTVSVSEEWSEVLKRTKDILSQKSGTAVSTEEALLVVMKEFCKRNDPVEKAKRQAVKESSNLVAPSSSGTAPTSVPARASLRNRYRIRAVEHAVNLRDNHQCTHVDRLGRRCEERKWLHKHHIHEFAKGGSHSAQNLETLCFAHHKMRHNEVVT